MLRAPAGIRASLLLPCWALLLVLAAAALLPLGAPDSLGAVAGAWRAALLATFTWTSGAHMLEIVFTGGGPRLPPPPSRTPQRHATTLLPHRSPTALVGHVARPAPQHWAH